MKSHINKLFLLLVFLTSSCTSYVLGPAKYDQFNAVPEFTGENRKWSDKEKQLFVGSCENEPSNFTDINAVCQCALTEVQGNYHSVKDFSSLGREELSQVSRVCTAETDQKEYYFYRNF